jgi:hypothetical protein
MPCRKSRAVFSDRPRFPNDPGLEHVYRIALKYGHAEDGDDRHFWAGYTFDGADLQGGIGHAPARGGRGGERGWWERALPTAGQEGDGAYLRKKAPL